MANERNTGRGAKETSEMIKSQPFREAAWQASA
jgi:hypothetical protein